MKKVELLSPVGNMEMLYQAIHNGADAVYLAGTLYGARKFAKNFTCEELAEAIGYAHLYGVKVYVTVNTLIYEDEFDDVIRYLLFLHQNGVDAVIVQDMGLIRVIREKFPNLEVHASTQCHNHNQEIVSLWKDLGVERVVLSREMSLEEIQSIDVDIEKEVFVYGALCVCYSGCCLFSSLNGGRSGNRGECVGSCRLPYRLVRNHEIVELPFSYLLSTKELNTIDHVKELIEAGIDSFKIEGRMKSPYYVGYVTKLYRMAIDLYYQGIDKKLSCEEINNLKKLFNREFTDGYLFQSSDIMNIKSPNHLGIPIGKVSKVTKEKVFIQLDKEGVSQEDGIRFFDINKGMILNKLYDVNGLLVNHIDKGSIAVIDNKFSCMVHKNELVLKTVDKKFIEELEKYSSKKIGICMRLQCYLGKEMELEVSDGEHTVFSRLGMVESSLKREVTTYEIERQLHKLGNTPFVLEGIEIKKDDFIFVSLRDLNELRRNAIDKLICIRKGEKKRVLENSFVEKSLASFRDSRCCLNVLVRTEEQLKCCLEYQVDTIYVTDYSLYLKYQDLGNIFYRVKRVNSSYQDFGCEKLLVGELGSVHRYRKNNALVGDYFLNVTNHYSIQFLNELGVERVTLSVELSDDKISSIMREEYPVELIIYGRLELMVMKSCPLKKCLHFCKECKNSKDKFYLEDKFGNQFPMIREDCLTHIMHFEVVDKVDGMEKYLKMGIHNYRVELFDEEKLEVKKILDGVKEKLKRE